MKKISYMLLPVLMFTFLFGSGVYASSVPNSAMMHNDGGLASAECNADHGCAATEHCSLCFEQSENSLRDAALEQADKLGIKYTVWENTNTGAIANETGQDRLALYAKWRKKAHDRDKIIGSVLKKE